MPRPEGDDGSNHNVAQPKNPTGKATPKPAVTPSGATGRPKGSTTSRSKPPAAKPTKPTTAAKPATAPPPSGQTFTTDSFLSALKMQESGGNYTARSSSSSASGAYQYLDSTWNHYGGYAHAWQAPQSVQDARARADVNAHLKKYGGDWEKVAAAHFAGSGWVDAHPDKSTWGQNPAPGSNNPTVSHYVSSLFGQAGKTAPTAAGATADESYAATSATSTPAEVKDKVAADYGYLAAFLDNPELGPLLMQAAKEGWDASRLQGALYKTKWYQTHSAVTREFDSQTKLDPATQKQAIEKQIFDITAQAKRAGIGLSHAQLAQLGWTSLRYGWSAQQLTNAIVAQGKMDLSGKNPNASLTTAANLKEAAAQYMVPVSDGQLQTWVKQIQAGELSINDFSGYLKEQAKSLFPGLSASIDRGVTVEQYADPYRNIAAQTLEVDPQSIDFMHDPKYQKALFQLDPKTKDRTSMSLADWGTYLRGLPEYGKTAQANQQAAGMATSILNVFGKVAS